MLFRAVRSAIRGFVVLNRGYSFIILLNLGIFEKIFLVIFSNFF